ncbi:MAG TPA: hypothetical protein PLH36_14990 [Armatimonadota bacterium]|nr:hypothetical protein [Armatimonadota bacterium]
MRLLPGLRAAYALYLLDATGVHSDHGAGASRQEAAEQILVVEE